MGAAAASSCLFCLHPFSLRCTGEWGFVIKEWETVTKMYPASARNLNRVSKQVDCDVYDPDGNRVDVSGTKIRINLVIGRMRTRDPEAVSIPGEQRSAC